MRQEGQAGWGQGLGSWVAGVRRGRARVAGVRGGRGRGDWASKVGYLWLLFLNVNCMQV